MKRIKRVITIFLIFIVMAASLVPSLRCSHFVYADTTDQWESVTTNQELADAFRYYCKSRNLAIEGSVADALTSFTTNTFNTICDTLGIDITALQAHLKRSTDSNGRLQFLFDQFGVTAYNRIFAEFLQNNNLEVGDDVEDQTLYSGVTFTNYDDTVVIATVTSQIKTSNLSGKYIIDKSNIYLGSVLYGIDRAYCKTLFDNVSTPTFTDFYSDYYTFYSRSDNSSTIQKRYVFYKQPNTKKINLLGVEAYKEGSLMWGYATILYNPNDGKFYVGAVYASPDYPNKFCTNYIDSNPVYPKNNLTDNVTIYITTNNNTINNNTYNDNSQTVINNDGDVYNYDYDDDDPPINPPSGGGDDNPNSPSDWGIDLPDLNIDWLLTGKENKFPFNIPFNIILALSLLNAEPEAPHFEGTVDLGVYQWTYDIDLQQFDPVAEVCRNFEFIAFLIGLMLLTKRLIWG